MTNKIAVITTFANAHFEPYAKRMLQTFVTNWPNDIPLLVQLDDDLLVSAVSQVVRTGFDAIAHGRLNEHKAFIERNKDREDQENYRFQAVRFCHKVFAIGRAYDAFKQSRQNGEPTTRYLIWLDADIFTTRKVTHDDIKECLPKEGDAVSYMGRKDWPHSECGWMAFDLENGGDTIIESLIGSYVSDLIMEQKERHDSWMFDIIVRGSGLKATNLTPDAKGMDVWEQSPMGKWSEHHKGPIAKAKLAKVAGISGAPLQNQLRKNGSNVIINTKNSLPDHVIQEHIKRNQELIENWISPCKENNEEIVVVSAGPMLIAEDVRAEKGKKIIAVKHALKPLKDAGITPWACILLDPRSHVADFVKDADPSVIWFVASQVDPTVTLNLLARGCKIWGYHAAVGANEDYLTIHQQGAIVVGGSATATRGLYMLNHLGFKRFTLYGYDLCNPDKPDTSLVDEHGQPKHLEMTIQTNDPLYRVKRLFFSEPQLMAQYEEINDLIKNKTFELKAHGNGIVPFMIKAKEVGDLRRKELRDKIAGINPPHYTELLNGNAAARNDARTGAANCGRPRARRAAAKNRCSV